MSRLRESNIDKITTAIYYLTRAKIPLGIISRIIIREEHTLAVFKRGMNKEQFSKYYARTVRIDCKGNKCKNHVNLRFNGHTTAGQAKVAICEYLNSIWNDYDPEHPVYDPDAYELNYRMLGDRDVLGMNLFIFNDDDLLNPADINTMGLDKKINDVYTNMVITGDMVVAGVD